MRTHIRNRTARATGLRVTAALSLGALVLTTAACGSETSADDTASDPAGQSTETSTPDTETAEPAPTGDAGEGTSGSGGEYLVGDAVADGQVQIVQASNVTGEPTEMATPLPTQETIDAFANGLDPALAPKVAKAAAEATAPAGTTLFGAVVAVGCEAPTSVTWTQTFDGIEVEPTLSKSTVQCLVPVTYVALLAVPV